ncbi:Vitelline membrane outer layer protein 1 homolog,Vitelline membrane outer layer protein 1 [Mytilus edulis]|uniref:Vitelline membrane outer layer protein 1 homolog,Vitelline membrane outer layer protein 1 n=1 Tax=Mytilus edulis TaxID=6550 RepID=A0A8S3S4X7_MYTED|nr:Vitelline membrane outer layer protein 1 homolog,Vitelline membrane outer layer protein 1 [Mytilus edulis]
MYIKLLLFSLVLCTIKASYPRHVVGTLYSSNGGVWGDWHEPRFCPTGQFAIGYSLKIERKQGTRGDDTSLNAIKLLCGTKNHRSNHGFAVTSGYGPWGDYSGIMKCGYTFFLTAFSLQVERSQGRGDDTAANYVRFRCKALTWSWPGYEIGGHGFWGDFGGWSTCPHGTAICGLRTKIEAPIRGDDTALNDVIFYCCK